jgi:AraC-like DNA-binding protein
VQELIERFATSNVRSSHRLDYWNRWASESSAGLTIESRNRSFDGILERWQIGDLILLRAQAEQSSVHRTAIQSGEERIRVHLQLRGMSEQHHAGRVTVLRPGDLSLCSSATAARHEANAHEIFVIDVRRSALEHRVPGLNNHLGCPTLATSPAAHSFSEFARALWREAGGPGLARESAWQEDCAGILLDLLGLAIRSSRGAMGTQMSLVERMKSLVDGRMGDPQLSAATIADELGVAVRTVQYSFASQATTPGNYIKQRRLERAAHRLAADEGASITDIAFDLGFNESAYFTRCFRQAYGVSPSAWRKSGRH